MCDGEGSADPDRGPPDEGVPGLGVGSEGGHGARSRGVEGCRAIAAAARSESAGDDRPPGPGPGVQKPRLDELAAAYGRSPGVVGAPRCEGQPRNGGVELALQERKHSLFWEAKDICELRRVIAERIDYYNGERMHSALGHQAPLVWVARLQTSA